MSDSVERSGLVPSPNYSGGNFTEIYEIAEEPGMLAKVVQKLWVDGAEVENYSREDFKREVGGDLEFLIDNGFGAFMPETSLEWSEELQRGVIRTEEVDGLPISECWGIDKEVALQLDELLSRTLQVGQQNLDKNRGIRRIPDVMWQGLINIRIGKTKSDPTPRPYLVDPYPASANVDPLMASWSDAVTTLRQQTAGGYAYPKTRLAILAFYKTPQLG